MPILGYNILSVNAGRNSKSPAAGKIDVSSTAKISSVEDRTINFPEKLEALGIGFEFNTEYKPDLANIKLTGEVVFADKDHKGIMKHWNKNKVLPDDVDLEIKNFLFRRCLTLELQLSQELQLPPPLVFPVFSKKEKSEGEKTKYIG